jgi:ubiquinone/menaquinone biosynthesis C-methylase UbiE
VSAQSDCGPIAVPAYLAEAYWWAYVDPRAVRLFERQWLVNLILWGNFGRLRDAALDALGPLLQGRTLQIACVYGDLTRKLSERHVHGGRVDVVDVLPVQLDNLKRKLPRNASVGLIHGDSTRLNLQPASYDRALLFFLLHEQPKGVRRATIAEAPRALEPFALDLWRCEIVEWLPREVREVKKATCFAGLYQLLTITV